MIYSVSGWDDTSMVEHIQLNATTDQEAVREACSMRADRFRDAKVIRVHTYDPDTGTFDRLVKEWGGLYDGYQLVGYDQSGKFSYVRRIDGVRAAFGDEDAAVEEATRLLTKYSPETVRAVLREFCFKLGAYGPTIWEYKKC